MAKDKVTTLDIKSLPRWQKYTVIAFVLVLAATFLISGAMIALVEFYAEGEEPNGYIGEEPVGAQFFRERHHVMSEVMRNPEAAELVFPEVAFYDPLHNVARPDPDHPWGMIFGEPVRIPEALNAQMLAESRPPQDRQEVIRELLGRLTWMHVLLLREAREAGVTVPAAEARLIAHELVLGPVEEDEPIAVEGEDEDEEAFEPPTTEEREQRFRDSVGGEIDPLRYHEIVREMLIVKRFVENEIDGTVSVSLEEALDSFTAGQQLLEAEYLRVPVFNERERASVPFEGPLPATLPGSLARHLQFDAEQEQLTFEGTLDRPLMRRMRAVSDEPTWQAAVEQLGEELSPFHPAVERRARQTLAEEREKAQVRRELAETTGVTSGALFPDPVEAYARERLNQDGGSEFREPRYQLAILPVRFRDMGEQAPIDPELIERFYDHEPYREQFLRTDLSDAEIEERLEELRGGVTMLAGDLISGFDELAKGAAPGWRAIEDQEATEWDIDELRADIEGPMREALRYRPFEEVRDEIREHLRNDAGEYRARMLVFQMQQEIQSRQRLNEEAFNHARAVADARLRQARLYEELYWGSRAEGGSEGLLVGAQEIERTLHRALRTMRRHAGLAHDPAGAQGDLFETQVETGRYRAALARLAEEIGERGWRHFIESTRIAEGMAVHENDPGRLARDLERLEAELARLDDARELEEVRQREIQEIHARWLNRRLEESRALRELYESAFAELDERIERELELTYLLELEEAPRLLLEERLEMLTDELGAILERAAEESAVQQRAVEARERALSATREFEPFRRSLEPQVEDLPVEGTVDVLRALPPRVFGVEPVRVHNELTFSGKLYDGLPGASVPPMRLRWGLTLEEIEQSERLREALPYFRDARVWDLETGSPGTESLSTVLGTLQPRTYSQPLGVAGVGYYVIALIDRSDPPMPSVAEVEERALELYLDRDSPDRRIAAANELAQELRKKLETRAAELQRTDAAKLATQLERATDRLAGTEGRTPYWPAGTAYERAAIEELVALLRGNDDVEVAVHSELATGQLDLDRRRAAHEARALLVRDTMYRLAEKYDLSVERTRPFGKEERLTRLWLTRGTEEFWRALSTLAPQFEFSPPIEETFPARGERDEDRRSNRRTAFVVARVLGTQAPEAEKLVEVADLDVESLENARTRLWVQRILEQPELRRFSDLSLMVSHLEETTGESVEILSRQPRRGGGPAR